MRIFLCILCILQGIGAILLSISSTDDNEFLIFVLIATCWLFIALYLFRRKSMRQVPDSECVNGFTVEYKDCGQPFVYRVTVGTKAVTCFSNTLLDDRDIFSVVDVLVKDGKLFLPRSATKVRIEVRDRREEATAE